MKGRYGQYDGFCLQMGIFLVKNWPYIWRRVFLIGSDHTLLSSYILPSLGLSSCRRPSFSIVQNIYHLCMANFFSCSRRVCWTDCTGHISDGTKCAFPWYRTLLVLCSDSCILLVVAVFFVRPRLTEFFLPLTRALCLLLPFLMHWGVLPLTILLLSLFSMSTFSIFVFEL